VSLTVYDLSYIKKLSVHQYPDFTSTQTIAYCKRQANNLAAG